jgi:PAS domain S-box-containing protein
MTPTHVQTGSGQSPSAGEQQALLDFAVSHSPVVFYVVSLQNDKPFTFVSSNVEAMTGLSPDKFLQDPEDIRNRVHPDDAVVHKNLVERLKQEGRLTLEYRFKSADGSYRWYRDDLRLTETGANVGREYVGCMIDVDAEVQARNQSEKTEKERQRLSEQLHEAVEVLNSGFYVIDKDDRIVTINSAMARQGSHDRDWYLGKNICALMREAVQKVESFNGEKVEPNDYWTERYCNYMKNPVDGPAEIQLKNGAWLLVTYHPMPDGGLASFGIQITSLKEAQQKLKESERYFRLMVEANPMPVWLTDMHDGEILYASPAAAGLMGAEAEPEKLKYSVDHYVDRKDWQAVIDTLNRDGQVLDFETRFRRLDGSEFWAAVNSRLIEFQGHEVSITGLVDRTGRKQREEELKQAHEILEDAIESLSEGFALFDPDDRLIMINSRYREFNEHADEFMAPGTSFADLTRASREHGNVAASEDEIEQWISYRNKRLGEGKPLLGYEFRHSDGRCYSYSHLPTRQGGCVVTKEDITERKEMERALRESEQMFRMLVENHPLPVALVEVESGEILYDSPAAKELTGRSDEEANTRKYATEHYVNPEDRKKMVAKLRAEGELRNYLTHYKRADGTRYWISTNSNLIEWHGLEVHIVSMIDLTEEREREEALQRAHETLEDAIESLSEGFALYDSDDVLITCNSRYREFNEICSDILKPGMRFKELVLTSAARNKYSRGIEEVDAWLKEHEANRYASYGGGFEFKQSDGRWVLYSNQPTRQGGMVVTLNDITKRKEMERALRDSEDSVRTILEASPVPLTMIHAETGQIIFESPVAQTIFRYDASKGYGSVVSRWPKPEDRQKYLRKLRETGALDSLDVVRVRADGTRFRGALSSRLINFRGEEVIISSIYDLTERLAMEEEMARQREVLHQSEKMVALGELLASVAHELNNPLSVVVGQAMLLQETAKDQAVTARAEKISAAANRCARIVKTFLSMARQQPAESVAMDLNELVDSALEVTGYGLRASNIDVNVKLSRSLPAVRVDPDQLTQVLTNLIVNAEHALRDWAGKRRLWISSNYRKKTNEVVVKIKDNGPGIPKESASRIFEPFFTTKEVGDGTGIGLAICHRILESHGGKIKHEVTPGGGATFVLRLPVESEHGPGPSEHSKTASKGKNLAVLVVDDEADVAELVRDILQVDGHLVETASSGSEALNMARERDFDIILSDIRMPELDGPELFAMLERMDPKYVRRIAFMTGDTLSQDVENFLASSGRPHLEKPITPADVRELIAGMRETRGQDHD